MTRIPGNPAPLKGKDPAIPTTNPTSLLINGLIHKRKAAGKPLIHVEPGTLNLTIGQVKFLKKNEIAIIMHDDLGSFELAEGPDNRVIKRRL